MLVALYFNAFTFDRLEQRRNPNAGSRAVVRKSPPRMAAGHLLMRCRQFLAVPRPRSYVQVLVATASVVFSVYMYMRTSGGPDILPALPGAPS
jgi:hypothetical protein